MRKYRVVHIEDEQDLRAAIKMALDHLPVELCSIPTAEQGISHLASSAPVDLVLCDFNFKGEQRDGLDVARCARLHRPTTPFVLISGGPRTCELADRFETLLKIPGVHFMEKCSLRSELLEDTILHFLPGLAA